VLKLAPFAKRLVPTGLREIWVNFISPVLEWRVLAHPELREFWGPLNGDLDSKGRLK